MAWCLQIPSQLAITRVGAPTWLGLLIFCWGVVAACTATMKTKAQFYVIRLLLGARSSSSSWGHVSSSRVTN